MKSKGKVLLDMEIPAERERGSMQLLPDLPNQVNQMQPIGLSSPKSGSPPSQSASSAMSCLYSRSKNRMKMSLDSERGARAGCEKRVEGFRAGRAAPKSEVKYQRKVEEVVRLVARWYSMTKKQGRVLPSSGKQKAQRQLSRKEAALLLEVPRKTLDDYILQVRLAKLMGYSFR
eukprot:CAMPEP_0168625856 /NCGR_PEP_ID=MMETSP0449_2-20121227/10275_1 /TAXON_ID=1082188 /ORGANISM="Strombidium rassoulzadegani, Strain ras09" /LENGTH=173 /DNA_ID=CAMNT_0008667719 /DNA_START=118 /DNA_END=639 /DNA_ORIENTATION=-